MHCCFFIRAKQPLASKASNPSAALLATSNFSTNLHRLRAQEMGGPEIPTRFGRTDAKTSAESVESQVGRLPDGDKGIDHLREIFHPKGACDRPHVRFTLRLKARNANELSIGVQIQPWQLMCLFQRFCRCTACFNDKDIVALSGAHTVGKCHIDRSGFEGAWTEEPLKFDNTYFKEMLSKKYESETTSAGNPQNRNAETGTIMLISDLALLEDDAFKTHVEKYASDQDAYFADFTSAWVRESTPKDYGSGSQKTLVIAWQAAVPHCHAPDIYFGGFLMQQLAVRAAIRITIARL
eukprot:6212691-Pleurochrysis_carterae.AAC.1